VLRILRFAIWSFYSSTCSPPWKEGILGFVLGCFVVGVVLGLYALGPKAELRVAQEVAEQLDLCQGKFSRATILFEKKNTLGTPFGDAIKSWAIPVDVQPAYVGPEAGLFSHYDPKTQVGTVKLHARR
jgi:hypothetical protein